MNRVLPVLLMSMTSLSFAADDFGALVHHWNFDEGREWHQMSFPYHSDAAIARDSVGALELSIPGKNKDATWASGRQYSGVRMNTGGLTAEDNIDTLNGTCSLSFWLKMGETKGYVIGDRQQIVYGVVFPSGRLGVVQHGKVCMSSKSRVTDDQWHHFVITRNARKGTMRLYVDGELEAGFTGVTGVLDGEYTRFGVSARNRKFTAVLDQVHIFRKEIHPETVRILYDNHAPKIYDQEHLVDREKTTRTGSILHLYTHDNELDKLQVCRFGQGKYGRVKSLGDGTFDYTPAEDFPGRDSFEVEVTDGKGGFCRAEMKVYDARFSEGTLVNTFTYSGNLPDIPGPETSEQHRKPMCVRIQGKKLPDLLIQGKGGIWHYQNQSSKGHIEFAEPVELKDSDGNKLQVSGAAMLHHDTMVIRQPDGILRLANLDHTGSSFTVQPGEPLKNEKGDDFKLEHRFFVFVDYDLDGKLDLVHGAGSGIFCYPNKGSNQTPVLASKSYSVCEDSYNTYPGLGDMDGDGRVDLLHGINWGFLHVWSSCAEGENMKHNRMRQALHLVKPPHKEFLRRMNGTNLLGEDMDGDGVVDLVVGCCLGGGVACGRGVDPDARRNNLKKIEKEIYKGNTKNLGRTLMARNQALLKRYMELMRDWIAWAIKQNTPASRAAAYNMLKKHVRKYPFLQRRYLETAWMKKDDKTGKIIEYGPMHLVPGIFTQNWIVLHQLMPDSAEHRKDVADALGLSGVDRDQYLTTGLPIADNNHCSEGQLLSIRDFMLRHPRILFPDDHLSIDLHFGDGRDAMCYVFRSNKNTFGSETGSFVNEMSGEMVRATEACLEGPGSANGDYFTLVMAHEVCHSLDAYVRRIPNQDLRRRWADVLIYAGNNGGKENLVVPSHTGWIDTEKTKNKFRKAGLWNGLEDWHKFWDKYWSKKCPYNELAFMRGNTGWFLYTTQESLATQANHHWTRSESRLIGAILRYKMGYKSNINEVVHFLDIISAGMNKIHMYHTVTSHETKKVEYRSDPAWLVRNDKGYITQLTLAGRTYVFDVNEQGRTVGIISNPFDEKLDELAKQFKPRK